MAKPAFLTLLQSALGDYLAQAIVRLEAVDAQARESTLLETMRQLQNLILRIERWHDETSLITKGTTGFAILTDIKKIHFQISSPESLRFHIAILKCLERVQAEITFDFIPKVMLNKFNPSQILVNCIEQLKSGIKHHLATLDKTHAIAFNLIRLSEDHDSLKAMLDEYIQHIQSQLAQQPGFNKESWIYMLRESIKSITSDIKKPLANCHVHLSYYQHLLNDLSATHFYELTGKKTAYVTELQDNITKLTQTLAEVEALQASITALEAPPIGDDDKLQNDDMEDDDLADNLIDDASDTTKQATINTFNQVGKLPNITTKDSFTAIPIGNTQRQLDSTALNNLFKETITAQRIEISSTHQGGHTLCLYRHHEHQGKYLTQPVYAAHPQAHNTLSNIIAELKNQGAHEAIIPVIEEKSGVFKWFSETAHVKTLHLVFPRAGNMMAQHTAYYYDSKPHNTVIFPSTHTQNVVKAALDINSDDITWIDCKPSTQRPHQPQLNRSDCGFWSLAYCRALFNLVPNNTKDIFNFDKVYINETEIQLRYISSVIKHETSKQCASEQAYRKNFILAAEALYNQITGESNLNTPKTSAAIQVLYEIMLLPRNREHAPSQAAPEQYKRQTALINKTLCMFTGKKTMQQTQPGDDVPMPATMQVAITQDDIIHYCNTAKQLRNSRTQKLATAMCLLGGIALIGISVISGGAPLLMACGWLAAGGGGLSTFAQPYTQATGNAMLKPGILPVPA